MEGWNQKVQKLQGPVLILGASGFIGANLMRTLFSIRSDVFGTASCFPAWRLEGLPEKNVLAMDLLVETNLTNVLNFVQPRTIFNCVAYGGYSFQKDVPHIYQTNMNFTVQLVEQLCHRTRTWFIHAGSSSEYGDYATHPPESTSLTPNSHYSVAKGASSSLIYYAGKKLGLPCANLRLYSVYGPLEDASRLIPTLIDKGKQGLYPPLVHPDISRDFIYIEDVCEAFVNAALYLKEVNYGDSFNIGTGVKTTISDVAFLSKDLFKIEKPPLFESMEDRKWDVSEWYANPDKAKTCLSWKAKTSLKDGLLRTIEWFEQIENLERYRRSSKQFGLDTTHSISAIIACYKDAQALPIMYERLVHVFEKLGVDYEIIFVNDNSPDDSEAVIRELSRNNRRVIGISHSRNFGSQSAFRSGMEISSKNACVLLDGDLQDPPEVIESFVEKWKEGYDVIYGRRVQREAPRYMQVAYKLFYRIFSKFSYIDIPKDAGDFSLIDKRVVRCLIQFPERDLFLRGIRAFAGFKQVGVDYKRPERMFGTSTNNLLKNIGWAKKGILSFTNTPLNILSSVGILLFSLSMLLLVFQTVMKLLIPEFAPAGVTTLILLITFFGSINLFAASLLGEYIAKIFEEVKRRPHFIRRSIIRDGTIRDASEDVRHYK
ncbi:NAD-dependent epimerase/dehydratase family protein [Deltaproteobacteria bacterium TL4]